MSKNCAICDTVFENEEDSIVVCSGACKAALELRNEVNSLITKTESSSDPRIFFYPLTFGEVVDRLTILILQRANCKRIRNQQETDYKIFRCKRSLQTHLGQLFNDPKLKDSINNLANHLMKINGRIFAIEDRARDRRIDPETRMKIYFDRIPLNEERVKTIKELEALQSGRILSFKTYDGVDI